MCLFFHALVWEGTCTQRVHASSASLQAVTVELEPHCPTARP